MFINFHFLWINIFPKDNIYGFGFLSFKFDDCVRSFLAIYWNAGALAFELGWIRILGRL